MYPRDISELTRASGVSIARRLSGAPPPSTAGFEPFESDAPRTMRRDLDAAPSIADMPCTLRQLQVFAAAADECHFRRTADRLGITQPAITKLIATLERRVGIRLFTRGRGVAPTLTADGVRFLEQARKLLAQADNIRACSTLATENEPAVVRIGVRGHLLFDYIKPWLPAFSRANPSIVVSCRQIDSRAHALELLEADALDMAVCTTQRPETPRFHWDAPCTTRLGIYGGRRFYEHRDASLEDLTSLPFLLPEAGSDAARMVSAALAHAGVACGNVAMRSQYHDVIVRLAIDGCGLVVAFDTMVETPVARGELFRFDVDLPEFHHTVYRRNAPPDGARALVESSVLDALRR